MYCAAATERPLCFAIIVTAVPINHAHVHFAVPTSLLSAVAQLHSGKPDDVRPNPSTLNGQEAS